MALIRSLRFLLLLGLACLLGGILMSLSANARLGDRIAPAEPKEPSTTGGVLAQEADNVEILRTRSGSPTLRMRASSSKSYTDGRLELSSVTFRLYGPDGQETVVEAPSASSTNLRESAAQAQTPPDAGREASLPDEGFGSWLLEGGVTVRGGGGFTLVTPRLEYHETLGEARTTDLVSFSRGTTRGTSLGMSYEVSSQVVQLRSDVRAEMPMGSMGLVSVRATSAVHDLKGRTFAMRDYGTSTERGETLSGARLVASFRDSGGIERLVGEEGFLLETQHAVQTSAPSSPLARLLALEGSRTMKGRRLAVEFTESSEPISIAISGDALLTAAGADPATTPSSIAARTLLFDLANGTVTRARAEGSVNLQGGSAAGDTGGFRMLSDLLDAAFDPNLGSLLNVEGEGAIHLTDQGMKSEGSRTFLDPNSDIVTLTGDEGRPASASWMGRRIQARQIEADRGRKTLSAKGGVRVSYEPQADAGAGQNPAQSVKPLPFFRTGETIYAMAGSLTFADQGRLARYRDRVRLWQADNRLEASEIDVNEGAGILEARGEVVSTFHQPPPANQAGVTNPSDEIITVAATTMKYERSSGRIVYSGRVLVTQGSLRVNSDSMVVTLAPDGGSADRMEATGSVTMRDRGREGHGDKLIGDPKTNTIRLMGTGREAVVQDESGQQVVRGVSLTMDRSGDRILVESEVGGRTWITLKPRQKGAPGVGSVPHD